MQMSQDEDEHGSDEDPEDTISIRCQQTYYLELAVVQHKLYGSSTIPGSIRMAHYTVKLT